MAKALVLILETIPSSFIPRRLLEKWLNIRISASNPPHLCLQAVNFSSFNHAFLNRLNGMTLFISQYALPKPACPGPTTTSSWSTPGGGHQVSLKPTILRREVWHPSHVPSPTDLTWVALASHWVWLWALSWMIHTVTPPVAKTKGYFSVN